MAISGVRKIAEPLGNANLELTIVLIERNSPSCFMKSICSFEGLPHFNGVHD
jgi:hypothetical protein